jgi:hypothetical protein
VQYLSGVTTPMKRPQSEFLPRAGAGCLVMLGGFMALSALGAMTVPPVEPLGGLVVMAIVGAGFAAAGIYWWRFVIGADARRRVEYQDKVVLGVASRHDGVVTVAQVALEADLSTDEAREAIERLCIRGLAQPDVRDDGSIEYRFGGLLRT